MPMRTNNKTVTFGRPFWLKGVDRMLPAGVTIDPADLETAVTGDSAGAPASARA